VPVGFFGVAGVGVIGPEVTAVPERGGRWVREVEALSVAEA